MSDFPSAGTGATRHEMIQANRYWSGLELVAEAVAAASETERVVYVERLGNLYRWSLTSRGNGYPLLRISARFLGVDHGGIFIGFRTLPNGTSILCEDPANFEEPDRWTLLELDGTITTSVVASMIRTALDEAALDD